MPDNQSCKACGGVLPVRQQPGRSHVDRRYVRCPSCLSYTLFPIPTPEMLHAYYSRMFHEGNYRVARISVTSNRVKFRHLLHKILATCAAQGIHPCKTILDIGCFNGGFLDIAREHRFETYGFEPMTESLVGIDADHRVWSGSLFDAPNDLPQFDLITLNDTIEHIADFRDQLQFIDSRLLRTDGGLIITTPNATSSIAKLMGRRWGMLDGTEHLLVYSRLGLTTLLQTNGFRIVQIKPYFKRMEFGYFQEMFFKWQISRRAKSLWLPPAMTRLRIVVYVGEVFVVAQKVGCRALDVEHKSS